MSSLTDAAIFLHFHESDSDSDSDDEPLSGSVEFEYEENPPEPPQINVRSLHGDDEYIRIYNENINPPLEAYMNDHYPSFLLFAIVLEFKIGEESGKFPYVSLGLPREETRAALTLASIPINPEEFGFGTVICKFEESFIDGDIFGYPSEKKIHRHLQSGIGIGSGTDQGTLGLLMRTQPLTTAANQKFMGVTAGHVIQRDVLVVTQPEVTEFTRRVNRLSDAIKDAKANMESPKSSVETIRQAQNSVANIDPEYTISAPYLKSTPSETAFALLAGTVVQKVTKPYEFEGRRCLLDYALFDVEDSRKPQPESVRRFYGGPEEGYLRDVK
jgi:hypothetical protein